MIQASHPIQPSLIRSNPTLASFSHHIQSIIHHPYFSTHPIPALPNPIYSNSTQLLPIEPYPVYYLPIHPSSSSSILTQSLTIQPSLSSLPPTKPHPPNSTSHHPPYSTSHHPTSLQPPISTSLQPPISTSLQPPNLNLPPPT